MTADTIGGVWTYALELSEALKPYGVEIYLATMGSPLTEKQKEALGMAGNIRLFESSYKLEWMEEPWKDVEEAGKWLLELEAAVQPDVIHLNGYSHGATPFRSPKLVVGHSCVYSWYYAVKQHAPHEAWHEYKRKVSEGLIKADLVTAPTKAMLSMLRRHYGSFRTAGAVYNARKAEDFLPGIKEEMVLSAGRLWDEAKNVSMLAYISPRLKWPVYMAGEKEDPEGRFIQTFNDVNWLGRLPSVELAAWMKKASIFALPARYEPFGLSPLEAALSGCALVLGDIPSLREVWQDAALFIKPDDHEGLKKTINALIGNEELRLNNVKKVRKRALFFTPERMARGYLSLYENILQRHKAYSPGVRRQAKCP
ncbi:MAG: glycosyltransferase family 4 protein [Ignavibacteria bacterium]|nr:glycosyltransferase family 4 protein [Ignavibacteria bacterium]MCU7502187.1 glycosyltransferase family 4 protein [Ignavibacteria bacterium]MCU7517404.1 glycosyltransferase family 4 protein [Ignavibacteria bacterium]